MNEPSPRFFDPRLPTPEGRRPRPSVGRPLPVTVSSLEPRYDFKILGVHKVVDGDTIDLHLDVGFRTVLTQRIRLAIVDTPERGDEPGYSRATLFLADWVRERLYDPSRESHILRLVTYKEDSLARWVGDLYDRRNGDTASAALLAADLGVVWSRR